ncbi:hypothetical protein ACCO45_011807 [Purpureocillium lilacinum]|uniref:Uncharacterized protein n=1 Tax=Purpureocillium lilacinum TaxID=33203 RepID=A0ACC4DBW6_PURLI
MGRPALRLFLLLLLLLLLLHNHHHSHSLALSTVQSLSCSSLFASLFVPPPPPPPSSLSPLSPVSSAILGIETRTASQTQAHKEITARHISSNPSIRETRRPLERRPLFFVDFSRLSSSVDVRFLTARPHLQFNFWRLHLAPLIDLTQNSVLLADQPLHSSRVSTRSRSHAAALSRTPTRQDGPDKAPEALHAFHRRRLLAVNINKPASASSPHPPSPSPPWCWPSSASANAAHAPTNTSPSVLVCPRHDSIASRRPVLSRNSSRPSGRRLVGPPAFKSTLGNDRRLLPADWLSCKQGATTAEADQHPHRRALMAAGL